MISQSPARKLRSRCIAKLEAAANAHVLLSMRAGKFVAVAGLTHMPIERTHPIVGQVYFELLFGAGFERGTGVAHQGRILQIQR